MSLHVRLQTSFFSHRKTAKLQSLIGNDALWLVPKLWCYAAQNQPDGNFENYSAEEIALLIGYTSNAPSMLQALQQAGFLDGMKLHDWAEHNGYHAVYKERARAAARARWSVLENGSEEKIRNEKKGKETSNASSMLVASPADFLSDLKTNPTYRGIDIDREIGRMRDWLLKPQGRGRKLTRGFIVNWLNKIEPPVMLSTPSRSKPPRELRPGIDYVKPDFGLNDDAA